MCIKKTIIVNIVCSVLVIIRSEITTDASIKTLEGLIWCHFSATETTLFLHPSTTAPPPPPFFFFLVGPCILDLSDGLWGALYSWQAERPRRGFGAMKFLDSRGREALPKHYVFIMGGQTATQTSDTIQSEPDGISFICLFCFCMKATLKK